MWPRLDETLSSYNALKLTKIKWSDSNSVAFRRKRHGRLRERELGLMWSTGNDQGVGGSGLHGVVCVSHSSEWWGIAQV